MTKVTGLKKNIAANKTEKLNIAFHKQMRDEMEKIIVNDPPYSPFLSGYITAYVQAEGEEGDPMVMIINRILNPNGLDQSPLKMAAHPQDNPFLSGYLAACVEIYGTEDNLISELANKMLIQDDDPSLNAAIKKRFKEALKELRFTKSLNVPMISGYVAAYYEMYDENEDHILTLANHLLNPDWHEQLVQQSRSPAIRKQNIDPARAKFAP
jgi:hypothetical protein